MSGPTKALGRSEFIALMAMLVATVAFSIDAMLPAFPSIAADLTPDEPNRVQLIVTFFVLGMGVGTLFAGPLADAFGRKTIIFFSSGLFIAGALLAWMAPTLELLLVARLIQGLGAAGPRIVTIALIRDLYSGRDMARILSFVFMIFSLVPALAPTIGHYVILGFGWRSIFMCFVLFCLLSCVWLGLRQPETLVAENRRSLDFRSLLDAVKEVLRSATSRTAIAVQMLMFAILFTTIQTIQPIFDETFNQGEYFHLWFGAFAVVGMTSSALNAWLVSRVGMRAILRTSFLVYTSVAAILLVIYTSVDSQLVHLILFCLLAQSGFYLAGLTLGNLNALALEPLGHIAGTASSVISALATVGGIFLALPIGMAFDGTPIPLAVGGLLCGAAAFWLSRQIKRPGEL